jgi:uncharacterized delta-60 repeat protein
LTISLSTVLITAVVGVTSFAAPGDLDTTFGDNGIVSTFRGVSCVAIQPDGKIVVAGTYLSGTYPNSIYEFAVSRYNPDGTLDTTFDGDGKVTTDIGYYAEAYAVALQPDGKIVVVGESFNFHLSLAVLRLNSDGSFDTSFDGDGKVTTDFEGVGFSVALQSDGKIVTAGATVSPSNTNFLIVRLNSNGSLDLSFDSDGKVTTDFNGGNDLANSVVLEPDGKIIAAGQSGGNLQSSFALVRYNADGSPDASFDDDGKATTVVNGNSDTANSVALQFDGRIVAVGSAGSDFALVRYNSNGLLDSSFDDDGKVTRHIQSYSGANSVVLQPDGKIVGVGSASWGSGSFDSSLFVVRYKSNGSPDTTFNDDGIVTIGGDDPDSDYYYGRAASLDSVGRIVVAGGGAVYRFLGGGKRSAFDFDGDGRSDVSVFRPDDSVWYLNRSTQGFCAAQFGLPTDKIVPADYDGDGKTDIAVFRDGTWWRINSGNSTVEVVHFGVPGDIPVPGDYNGDGRDELGVYRDGQWWTLDLDNGQASVVNFGLSTDKPIPADYDGDGRVDQAVYREGEWHLNRSRDGYIVAPFGLPNDKPVVGDYDGDSKADLAVYRDGIWHLLQSTAGYKTLEWGLSTDIPTPADYDGDGKTDAAIYRDGTWWILKSTAGYNVAQFGLAGDKPAPGAYIR